MVQPFDVLVKPRGAICNLDCTYCYYLSKERLFPGSSFRMGEATLQAYIQQLLATHPGPEVVFAWQGGEPLLMGLEFYQHAVELQQRFCPPGKTVSNTLQTNGVLLNRQWARFFKAQHFLVGLSLDGPAALHDAYRRDKGGRPTFTAVMAGLRCLQQEGVDINVLTTVHAANAPHPQTVYQFLRDEAQAQFIQFIPIVERTADDPAGVTARSVGSRQYGEFLTAVFDDWVQQDVGRVFVQLFDVALGVWLGYPAGLCVFSETCGRALAVEHTGDVYACDHFVDPHYHLGNLEITSLHELVQAPALQQFGAAKRDALPQYCQECPVRFICQGECPKNRFCATPTGEPGLNYLCAGYRLFFAHIDAPMRWMAQAIRQGQSPAGIMTRRIP